MSAPPASFTTMLSEGFADLFASAGIGVAWQPSGVYANDLTGIYVEVVPTSPDRVVVLTVTLLAADPTLSDSAFNLQIRTRAGRDPRDVYALDDALTDQVLGHYPLTLPNGVRVSKQRVLSSGSLGPDDNQRMQRSSNVQGVAYRPGPYRH